MLTEIPSALHTAAQSLCDSLRAKGPFLRCHKKARSPLRCKFLSMPGAFWMGSRKVQAGMRQCGSKTEDPARHRYLAGASGQGATYTRLVMEYAGSQQGAIYFLREINTEITVFLGINFASLAKHLLLLRKEATMPRIIRLSVPAL